MHMCSSYGCFSWQTWLCNTAPPLWSLSAVPGRELVCKQAVLLVSKQVFSPLVLSAIAENNHFRWRYWAVILFHQIVHQSCKKYGLLGFLWHLGNIYCIRKSCVLWDPQLKYLTISLVDAFVSDAGIYQRAKVCLQFSLWSRGAQTCVEGVISATLYIQLIIYFFSKVWMTLGALPFLQKILWAWLAGWFYLIFFLQLSSWLHSCKGICWIPSVVHLGWGWEAGFIYKSFCRIRAFCSRMSLFILRLITFHFPTETTIIILTINHAVT